MRCETVIEHFQAYLLENTEDINNSLAPHLQNCEYCRKDCQALLKKYPECASNITGANWKKIRQALHQVKLTEETAYSFTFLESKPILLNCLSELGQARQDFMADPKGFTL
ncbi:MAG: hypothetical protein FD167_3932, partial [bacterium]